MALRIGIFILVQLFVLQLAWGVRTNPQIKEKEILDNILKTYDSRIRPLGTNATHDSTTTVVAVNMYVLGLTKLDDKNWDYNIQLYFRQHWHDDRFRYNDAGGSVKFLSVDDVTKIWTPDIFFLNERKGVQHSLVKPNQFMRIYPNGNIIYSIRVSLTLSCPMDLHWLPFDSQVCSLRMESYGWTATEGLRLRWKKEEDDPIKFSENINLATLKLDHFDAEECNVVLSTGEYSCLKLNLHLKRNINYYLLNVFIPSAMLAMASWIPFWLHCYQITARVALGVTVLLAMSFTTTAFNATLVTVSYTKSIDFYTGVCMTFVFVALLETATVNFYAGPKDRKGGKTEDIIDMKPIPGDTTLDEAANGRPCKLRFRERAVDYKQWLTPKTTTSKRLDIISRIVFPISFVLFLAVYWITNLLHSED